MNKNDLINKITELLNEKDNIIRTHINRVYNKEKYNLTASNINPISLYTDLVPGT